MDSPADLTPAIEVRKLSVRFGTHAVLRNIDFQLEYGEFAVIVGRSGAGKTTLLRAIAGLHPAEGAVRVRGRLRMVFQKSGLLPWRRVAGNLAIGLTPEVLATLQAQCAVGTSQVESKRVLKRRIVDSLLGELGIRELRHRRPNEISGGEQQRVAIGRAFAPQPDVVLSDEPFGHLDVFTRERMQVWLLDFWQRHRAAVLFTTHSLEEALLLGDRIMILDRGSISHDSRVPFPRPRAADLQFSPEFLKVRRELRDMIAGTTNNPDHG